MQDPPLVILVCGLRFKIRASRTSALHSLYVTCRIWQSSISLNFSLFTFYSLLGGKAFPKCLCFVCTLTFIFLYFWCNHSVFCCFLWFANRRIYILIYPKHPSRQTISILNILTLELNLWRYDNKFVSIFLTSHSWTLTTVICSVETE